MVSPITQGADFNFFQKVTVSGASFATNADVAINIKFQEGFTISNEGTSVIEYSFNGTTLHGDLDSAKDSKTVKFDHRRVTAIWFRLKSGSSSVVRVEAWSTKYGINVNRIFIY